jgi:Cu+-exporting ATPase
MENKKFNLRVEGMTCAACALRVEKTIKKHPGVTEVRVNLATEKATFFGDAGDFNLNELSRKISGIGYRLILEEKQEYSAERKARIARRDLIWAWIITGPASLLMILVMTGVIRIPHWHLLEMGLAFPVIFIIGRKVLKSAFQAIFHFSPNMDVLITLGTLASYLTGILSLSGVRISNFALVGAMIMGFHLIGKYLESAARGKASAAIRKLLELGAKEAAILVNGVEKTVRIEDLQIGDIMIIRPGTKIPTDGIIIEGSTSLDESLATGESLPINKGIGDELLGGTLNQQGMVKARVSRVGQETFLSQIIRLVEEAQGSKIPIQEFADRVIGIFVPVILIIALGVFIFWLVFPDLGKSLLIWGQNWIPWINPELGRLTLAVFAAIATLVIACPCALGLATPTALMVGSGLGAQKGILIRDGAAIQTIKDVDTVLLDKTGTITHGKPRVVDVKCHIPNVEFLTLLGACEKYSEHPLAKAIVEYTRNQEIQVPDAEDFKSITGKGVEAVINGISYVAGSPDFLTEKGIETKTLRTETVPFESEGKTIVALADPDTVLGFVAIADTIKTDSPQAVSQLMNMGIRVVMITGDNPGTAKAIAHQVGITEFHSRIMPEDKHRYVRELQDKGHRVAMVGDGINDAPALIQADVGIAIGSGADIAIEAGDITLVRGGLMEVVKAVRLANATFKKIKQNLFWAFFYNLVAIPLAMIGFLHPVVAEIAMAFSSVNVVTNSLRLKKTSLEPEEKSSLS